MTTDCSTNLFGFTEVEGREVVAAFDGGAITLDAGKARRERILRSRDWADRSICGVLSRRAVPGAGRAPSRNDGRAARIWASRLAMRTSTTPDELRHDPIMAVLAGKLTARREDYSRQVNAQSAGAEQAAADANQP
jgi:hypothetical protein